jgi:starch synthase
MANHAIQPCILFVIPEVCFVPDGSGQSSDYLNCKAGGFAGFLCNLVGDLYGRGADVHIVQPNYRSVFALILQNKPRIKGCRMPQGHVHLTEDRVFYYAREPQSDSVRENIKISLAFQREVINQILPLVKPDLIHCHDWMCGLIPAVARKMGIPCIFTLQSCETAKCVLSEVEDTGIDAALFWQQLYFDRFPVSYEETRETNAIDFLLSGVFAARHVSIASPALLVKIADYIIRFPEAPLGRILSEKLAVDCNAAIESCPAGVRTVDLYERLLRRPILKTGSNKSKSRNEFRRQNRVVADAVFELFESGRTKFFAAT